MRDSTVFEKGGHVTNLIDFYKSECCHRLHSGKTVDCLYLEYQKESDSILHVRLIKKLDCQI